MPRELLILRHAKSDWDAGAATDFARPLNQRGKRDATRIGAWFLQVGLVPDLVVSSPARRARQTALRVCRPLAIGKGQIRWEPQVYEADLTVLLGVLERCPPEAARVLLIGHNPGLEALVEHLCGDALDRPQDAGLLPTATLARLELSDQGAPLRRGAARLVALTRPRDLYGA